MILVFRGYIIRVYDDKKIKVRIETEDVVKVNTLLNQLYVVKKNLNEVNINVAQAEIEVNLQYQTLDDLIGAYVTIRAHTTYYSFSKDDDDFKKIFRGHRIVADNIQSVT